MRNIYITTILLLLLSSCASIPVTVPEENVKNINRIAVVSLLGDKIKFKYVGTTILQNIINTYDIKEWRIDARIEGLVKNELEKNAKLHVINVNYDRNKLNNIYNSRNTFLNSDYDINYVSDYLKEIAKIYHLDALILIAEAKIDIINTPQIIYGYTLYSRSAWGKQQETGLCLISSIDVIDLHSLKTIARQNLFFNEKLDASFAKIDIAELSRDQILFLKEKTYSNIDERIPFSLKKFNLSNK